ncbi:MAG: ABC transporter permease subunit [Gemmatimonadaceae bacterium]|nr:ABC transporter permease subunit [Gemmatimonadaceae bacterium]
MTTMWKMVRYQARDVARSRWLAAYTLFFAAATEGLLRFAGGSAQALASVASVVMFVVPLATIVFGTVYVYNAREFIELVLAQPVRRRQLFAGLYLGLVLPLAVGFVVGLGLPFALHGVDDPALRAPLATLIAVGVALTAIFTGIALLIAVRTDDRLRALGAAIGIWLACSLVYDGVVLLLVATFADYQLERPMIALMLANPVDLARVALLLQLDAAALMGYTGAVLQRFLGTAAGTATAAAALALWIAAPATLGARAFRRKDF